MLLSNLYLSQTSFAKINPKKNRSLKFKKSNVVFKKIMQSSVPFKELCLLQRLVKGILYWPLLCCPLFRQTYYNLIKL